MSRTRVPNQELASDAARTNLLVNGAMSIWQRGTGTFTIQPGSPVIYSQYAAYTCDRWLGGVNGTSILTVTRNLNASGVGGSTNYGAVGGFTYNNGVGSFYQRLNFHVEGWDELRVRTITLSIRVWANAPNAVSVMLGSDGTGAATVQSAQHPGDSVWRTYTVTYTVPVDATYIQAGLNFTASVGQWAADNAALVEGSVAADPAPLVHPADDLARCQRYYEKQNPEISGVTTAAGQNLLAAYPFRVPKPSTPTLTVAGTWTAQNISPASWAGVAQRVPGDMYFAYVTSAAAGAAGIYPTSSGSPPGYVAIEANP